MTVNHCVMIRVSGVEEVSDVQLLVPLHKSRRCTSCVMPLTAAETPVNNGLQGEDQI
jgi:hypothetical protein